MLCQQLNLSLVFCTDVLSNNSGAGRLFAGDSGTLTISGVDADVLHVGNFLCDPANLMHQVTKIQARIVVFNVMMPIIKGTQVSSGKTIFQALI